MCYYAQSLKPSRVEGWGGLAWYLNYIGIACSESSLETRKRRYGLPGRGGGVRGRHVYFLRADIEIWVMHFTGTDLDAWILLRQEAFRVGRPPPCVKRHQHAAQWTILPAWRMYAVVTLCPTLGWQVWRTKHGSGYFSRWATEMEDVFRGDSTPRSQWSIRLYRTSRLSTPADLDVPPNVSPARYRGHTLIGAVHRIGQTFHFCRVAGDIFGLAREVTTPFLATKGLPRFSEARSWIESKYAKVMWITLTDSVPVKPVTLEASLDDPLADPDILRAIGLSPRPT